MAKWNKRLSFCFRSNGLTLIELMVALAVAAILLVMAVPSFVTALHNGRIATAAEQLYVSLAQARGAAVKTGDAVRVCPSSDSATCRNDGDWSDGWLIFQDADADGAPDVGETIKAVPGTSLAGGVDIGSEDTVEDFVEFGSTGGTINSGTAGAFWVCHSNSSVSSRQISVSLSGRIEDTTRVQSDCNATS